MLPSQDQAYPIQNLPAISLSTKAMVPLVGLSQSGDWFEQRAFADGRGPARAGTRSLLFSLSRARDESGRGSVERHPCQPVPGDAPASAGSCALNSEVFARVMPGVAVIFRMDINVWTRDHPPGSIITRSQAASSAGSDERVRSHRTVT